MGAKNQKRIICNNPIGSKQMVSFCALVKSTETTPRFAITFTNLAKVKATRPLFLLKGPSTTPLLKKPLIQKMPLPKLFYPPVNASK
jgi:hypothetical protein